MPAFFSTLFIKQICTDHLCARHHFLQWYKNQHDSCPHGACWGRQALNYNNLPREKCVKSTLQKSHRELWESVTGISILLGFLLLWKGEYLPWEVTNWIGVDQAKIEGKNQNIPVFFKPEDVLSSLHLKVEKHKKCMYVYVCIGREEKREELPTALCKW